jgi:hypothetical protein
MFIRLCQLCNEDKAWDEAAKKNSKASGFYGLSCWSCHLKLTNLRNRTGASVLREAKNRDRVMTNMRAVYQQILADK